MHPAGLTAEVITPSLRQQLGKLPTRGKVAGLGAGGATGGDLVSPDTVASLTGAHCLWLFKYVLLVAMQQERSWRQCVRHISCNIPAVASSVQVALTATLSLTTRLTKAARSLSRLT